MLYSPSENTVHVYCSTMYEAHIQSPFSQIIIEEILNSRIYCSALYSPTKLHFENFSLFNLDNSERKICQNIMYNE